MEQITLAFFIITFLDVAEKHLDFIEALLSKETVHVIG